MVRPLCFLARLVASRLSSKIFSGPQELVQGRMVRDTTTKRLPGADDDIPHHGGSYRHAVVGGRC
jgi:hypothetical protein